jgi:hypothetical protein
MTNLRAAALALLIALASCAPAFAQSRDDNLVSGSGSATGTGATQIIPAPSQNIYVTAVRCGRTDAGTTAMYVTFNDDGSTTMMLPNADGFMSRTLVCCGRPALKAIASVVALRRLFPAEPMRRWPNINSGQQVRE